jgi:hypothetical protein
MYAVESEETNTALLLDKVASARAGSPKEAIAAAMVIHMACTARDVSLRHGGALIHPVA